MAFGPLSDLHFLPTSVAATIVLVLVVAGLYFVWAPSRVRGRDVSAVAAILATNLAVFVVQSIGAFFDRGILIAILVENGLTPALFLQGRQWWAIVTNMFVHGDLLHLLLNMLVLWFIGSLLERRLGRRMFVLLYLTAGLFAGIVTLLGAWLVPEAVHRFIPAMPTMEIPNVGASGAIFGLLGHLVVANPKERFMLIFPLPVVMPAWVLATGFVIFNLVLAFIPGSRIAWWAHLGGMLVGAVWARVQKKRGGRVRIDGVTGWGSGGPVRYTYTYRPR